MTKIERSMIAVLALIGGLLMWSSAWAQPRDFSKIQIETTELAPNLYMLTGAGGNTGLLVGDDQVLLIDSQHSQLSNKIMRAIKAITDKPVTYLLNTHMHGDHIGGNESFVNKGAIVVSHDKVRTRLSSVQYSRLRQREIPPVASAALPTLTFSQNIHLYIGDIDVIAVYSPRSHTDGDTIAEFRGANVIQMGDLFFNGTFPYIDIGAGGSLNGLIAACELALARMDRNTKIIPGHGPLATRADFRNYIRMLKRVYRLINKAISDGQSKEDVLAANPLQSLEAEWGDGVLTAPVFTELMFDIVKAEPRTHNKRRSRR